MLRENFTSQTGCNLQMSTPIFHQTPLFFFKQKKGNRNDAIYIYDSRHPQSQKELFLYRRKGIHCTTPSSLGVKTEKRNGLRRRKSILLLYSACLSRYLLRQKHHFHFRYFRVSLSIHAFTYFQRNTRTYSQKI